MKLKINVLNKMIQKSSNREIDFFLYLVKRQNSMGCVDGIYYKDVMRDLHLPKSTFYVVLQKLQEKDFIYLRDLDDGTGFNIFIHNNSFITNSDYQEGYVNINLEYILSTNFLLLNVNLKKFFLRLLSLQANIKQVKILKDTLKRYKVNTLINELSKMFHMMLDGEGYLFKIKTKLLEKDEGNAEYLQYEHKVIVYCKYYSLAYTKKELRDTVRSIMGQLNNNKMARIQKALDAIRKKGRLQPKLINHICGSGMASVPLIY